MTRSILPPGPEAPEPTASELQALYRNAAQAEPDAMLDRKILDAARAELRDAGEAKARRTPPWWKGWLPAASALAIALVGLSVTWRVMDQQERDLRQEMKAAEGVRERSVAAPASVAPAPGAADALSSPRAPAPVAEKDRRAESKAVRDAPPAAPAPAAMPAPATPAPMTPAVADEALKKSLRAEKEELRERRDASAAMDAPPGPARQAGKLEAGGSAIGSSGSGNVRAADSLAAPAANPAAKSAAAPAVDGASPEAWLKQIRELRAAGRSAEAAESLARFRARYPDFAVPDDLLKLK
jgi:hypothetical protein